MSRRVARRRVPIDEGQLPPAGLVPDDPAWFNAAAHHAAAEVIDATITSAMSGPMNVTVVDTVGTHRQHVTLVDAPAGAGKDDLVTEVVRRAHAAGIRLLVVTPGNDQLGELARCAPHGCSAVRPARSGSCIERVSSVMSRASSDPSG